MSRHARVTIDGIEISVRESVAWEILAILTRPYAVKIVQLGDVMTAGANAIPVGGSGVFQAQPNQGSWPAGTSFGWSSKDGNITFTQVSTDPTGATVTATDAAGDAAAEADISVSVQLPGTPAPQPLLGTDEIELTGGVVPTGVNVVQLS